MVFAPRPWLVSGIRPRDGPVSAIRRIFAAIVPVLDQPGGSALLGGRSGFQSSKESVIEM
jgi:hypothetical protein